MMPGKKMMGRIPGSGSDAGVEGAGRVKFSAVGEADPTIGEVDPGLAEGCAPGRSAVGLPRARTP
jgi:hypothetical protein